MKRICIPLLAGAVGCASMLQFAAAESFDTQETVVHSFGSGNDGQDPIASLTDVKGVLYGTTYAGGTNCQNYAACGTVFALDPNTGVETVLYSFCKQQFRLRLSGRHLPEICLDGASPRANVIDVKGMLYGTTEFGGKFGYGTVFALDPSTGAETVLHSFCKDGAPCADGMDPSTGLIDFNGVLYGTATQGGNCEDGCGVIFSVNRKTGSESVLHSFCSVQGNCPDGEFPSSNLVEVQGKLYGTTTEGGTYGGGTLFSLDPSNNQETVVYSFCSQNCEDGKAPGGGLIYVNGMLYGTTTNGGANLSCQFGCGTIFSFDLGTGAEKVLYSFCKKRNCTDGSFPYSNLIDTNGRLYGTTATGGKYNAGTAFALDPNTGVEDVLYSFCSELNCTDGRSPYAGLIHMGQTLYGTTPTGGGNNYGTIFSIGGQ